MTNIWYYVWSFIYTIIHPIVFNVLVALGISYVTYQGMDYTLTYLRTAMVMHLGSSSHTILAMLGYLGIDKCLNLIFSAFAFRVVMMGFNQGSKVKIGFNTPPTGN